MINSAWGRGGVERRPGGGSIPVKEKVKAPGRDIACGTGR